MFTKVISPLIAIVLLTVGLTSMMETNREIGSPEMNTYMDSLDLINQRIQQITALQDTNRILRQENELCIGQIKRLYKSDVNGLIAMLQNEIDRGRIIAEEDLIDMVGDSLYKLHFIKRKEQILLDTDLTLTADVKIKPIQVSRTRVILKPEPVNQLEMMIKQIKVDKLEMDQLMSESVYNSKYIVWIEKGKKKSRVGTYHKEFLVSHDMVGDSSDFEDLLIARNVYINDRTQVLAKKITRMENIIKTRKKND